MIQRKDNLTDVVERLPKAETFEFANKPNGKQEQQVIGNNGEIVTLQQKMNKK